MILLNIMSGEFIKLMIFLIVLIIFIIITIIKTKRNDKIATNKIANETYDVSMKGDNWWALRFDGLKKDYEDREIYLSNKFEQLKTDYESRESFIRNMFDEIKKELIIEKKFTEEKQTEIQALQRELQLKNKRIVELELQLLKTLSGISKDKLTTEEVDILNNIKNINENE